jgi:hypothetical protein
LNITLPAFGPDLPVHPRTGLAAIGLLRNGAPVWPVMGGSEDDGVTDDSGDDVGSDDDAKDLGDAGKQAIDRMKASERKARADLRDAKQRLAAYEKAESDKADADKSAEERRAAAEKRAADAELKALRLEVANDKGLTAAQAKRLVGATKEELEADADELLEILPARKEQEKDKPKPKPDPSQGNRGGKPLSGREAAMAEAQKRFGVKSNA